jgi:hypothetical protein
MNSVFTKSFLTLVALGTSLGCKKDAPVPPKEPVAAVAKKAAVSTEFLPDFVDKELYTALHKVVDLCPVDVSVSEVNCKDKTFSNIVLLFQRAVSPRHSAMATVSYILEQKNEAVKTVGVELFSQAFNSRQGTLPLKPVAEKLLAQLAALPVPQAIDAAPAIVIIAMPHNLDEVVFKVLDGFQDKRVAVAGYRNVMIDGRVRVLDKIDSLVKSAQLELALAAVDAVTVMGGRTVEENAKLCTWASGLLGDTRPLVQMRVAGLLASCGTKHIDALLVVDEKRQLERKPLIAGFDVYRDVCDHTVKNAFGNATAAQCARLKRLASNTVNDPNFTERDRANALNLLATQFPGKDVLAVAEQLADNTLPALARQARSVVQDLSGAKNALH